MEHRAEAVDAPPLSGKSDVATSLVQRKVLHAKRITRIVSSSPESGLARLSSRVTFLLTELIELCLNAIVKRQSSMGCLASLY